MTTQLEAILAEREACARIIDPEVFELIEHYSTLGAAWGDPRDEDGTFKAYPQLRERRDTAYTKADQILALRPTPASEEPPAVLAHELVPERYGEPLNDFGADGWLPIESAPKDGTEILAWCVHPNAEFSDEAQWQCPVVARWIDHNGGGWTWHGRAFHPLASAPRTSFHPGTTMTRDVEGVAKGLTEAQRIYLIALAASPEPYEPRHGATANWALRHHYADTWLVLSDGRKGPCRTLMPIEYASVVISQIGGQVLTPFGRELAAHLLAQDKSQ